MNSPSRSLAQSQPISNDDLEIDLNEENIEPADQSPSYGGHKSDDSSPAETSKMKGFEPSIEIIQVKTEKSEKNIPRRIAEINVIYETHKEAKPKKFGNSFIEFEEIPEIKRNDLTFTLDRKQEKSNNNVICELKTFDDRKKHVEEEERRSKSLKQKREEALSKMKKDKSIEKPQQEKKTFNNEVYEELERKAKDEQNHAKKRKLSQERGQVKSIEKNWMQEDGNNRKHEKSLKNERQSNNLNLEQENKFHHQNQEIQEIQEIVRFEKKSPMQQEKLYHLRDSQEIIQYGKKLAGQEKNKEVKYSQIENKRKVEQQKLLREDLEITEKSDFSVYKNIVWHKSRFNEADICDICGNADPGDFDSIYICDLCHCTTHQSCYGGDLADRNAINDSSDDWFCQRCSQLLKKNLSFDSIKCLFCPELKGSIKACTDEKDTKFWVHLSCVNWIPDIYFSTKNNTHNEVVLKGLRKDRFNVVCFICGIKYGACVQCDFHNCSISFHVTCGQRNGLIPTHDQTVKYGTILKSIYYIEIYCRKHQKTKYPEEMQIELMQIQSNYLRERASFSYLCFEDTMKTQKITKRRIVDNINNPPARINPKEFVSGMEQQKRIKRILKSQKMDDFIDLEEQESHENEIDEEDLFKPNSVDSSPRESKIKPDILERKTAPIQKNFDHFKNINSSESSPPRNNRISVHAPKKAAISNKNLKKNVEPKPLKKNSITRPQTNSNNINSYHNTNNATVNSNNNITPYQRNIGSFLMDKTSESSSITQSDDVKRRTFVIKKAAPKPTKEKTEGIYDKFAKLFDEMESDKKPENTESHAKNESSLASMKMDKPSNKRKTSGSHDLSQDEAVEPQPRKRMKLISENNFTTASHIKTARPMNLKSFLVDSSEDEKSELFPEERKSNEEEEEEKKEEFGFRNNNFQNLINSNRLPVINEGIEIEKENTPEKESLHDIMKSFNEERTKINSLENLMKPSEIQNISPILSQLHQLIIPSKKKEIVMPEDEKVTIPLKQLLTSMENPQQNEKSQIFTENQLKNVEATPLQLPANVKITMPPPVQISEKPIEEFKEAKIKKIQKIETPQNEKTTNILKSVTYEKPSINEDIFDDPTNFEERKNHPKINMNNNSINENQDNNNDEIKYLETHKPEKKIEIRKEKLKRLLPVVEVKAARKNKENFCFSHPTHIWGVVTSNAFKIEFENMKELMAKLGEDFLGLKMRIDR